MNHKLTLTNITYSCGKEGEGLMKKRKLIQRIISIIMIMTISVLEFPINCYTTREVYAASNIWDGSTIDKNWEGRGTEKEPYLITNAEELAGLASASLSNSYKGVYFRQTEDIFLNDIK